MIFTRAGRISGATLCALLAALTACWLVRDLMTAAGPADLWWFWAGESSGPASAPLTTSVQDGVLLLVYVAVAVSVPRSPNAASAVAAAGVLTLAVRLPGLWVTGADWTAERVPAELRERGLYSAVGALVLALGLLVTAAAGRGAPPSAYARVPTGPGRGAAVTATLLLVAAAADLAAWEVHSALHAPWNAYRGRYTGDASFSLPLLGTPPGWLTAATVLLCLAAALAALARAPLSRPLGMTAAALLVGAGGEGLARALRHDLIARFGELPVLQQLNLAGWLFELAAGALTLLVLARPGRGRGDASEGPGAGRQGRHAQRPSAGGSAVGPPPPAVLPPEW